MIILGFKILLLGLSVVFLNLSILILVIKTLKKADEIYISLLNKKKSEQENDIIAVIAVAVVCFEVS